MSHYSELNLQSSMLGYQRFMYLLTKYPMEMERTNFSPCPPIDLIWHTYLAQSASYHKDSERLVGHVHHHKLLPKSMVVSSLWIHNLFDSCLNTSLVLVPVFLLHIDNKCYREN